MRIQQGKPRPDCFGLHTICRIPVMNARADMCRVQAYIELPIARAVSLIQDPLRDQVRDKANESLWRLW